MPPPPILDPVELDLSRIVAGPQQIEEANPHRYEFRLLDAVVLLDQDRNAFAGYHDVRPDAFWVRGHIPGRPLFPGVLMVEAAAQLASYLHHQVFDTPQFLGFVGVDNVKFRGTVAPPARFVIIGRSKILKPRRMVAELQGFVNNAMVFEGEITGMAV